MSLTETKRLEMRRGLKQRLGNDVADSLMEHLPPVAWADVARQADLEHLRSYMDTRFNAVDARFSGIVAGLWALGAICVACFAGIFTVLITEL
jgi:hypothetical protein